MPDTNPGPSVTDQHDPPAPVLTLMSGGGRAADGTADRLLTADDVAAILGVTRSLVYALVRSGEMPAVRIGERYIRFRSQALLRWIESREGCETKRRR
ncbi:MAG: helix-turn-helix transcriptional regulator [Solirubrobacteraceae bacterium]